MNDIMVDNFNIGQWDDFNEPDEAVLCIDSLINNPCKMMIDKHNLESKMEYFHFILPAVAKLFNIDRKKLSEQWVDVFGYYECFGEQK